MKKTIKSLKTSLRLYATMILTLAVVAAFHHVILMTTTQQILITTRKELTS